MILLLLKEPFEPAAGAVRREPDGKIKPRFPREADYPPAYIQLETLRGAPFQLVYYGFNIAFGKRSLVHWSQLL
jgi:hypothetical protein